MKESEPAAGAPGTPSMPESQSERTPQRRDRQDDTPLVVEVAWLVIETATAVARLHRILARL